jgi:(2Fe-2S) ferredoxin
MTFFCRVGNIQEQNSTGQVSYDGFGFQPLVTIVFSNSAADGWATSFATQIGMTTDYDHQFGFGGSAKHGVNPSNAHRVNDQSAMFSCEWGGTEYGRMGQWTFDNDGFTVNWDLAGTSPRHIGYITMGGTSLQDWGAYRFATPAGAGDMVCDGVGFKPDFVILMGDETHTIDGGGNNSIGTNFLQQMGAFNSKGEQWAKYEYSVHNVSPTQTGTIQTTNYCWIGSSGTTSVKYKAHFVSMDDDGFTINFDTNDAVRYIWAFCIKGPQTSIGAWNKSTAASGVTETITTTLPNAVQSVLLATNSKTTSDGNRQAGMRHSIGASDGTNAWNCIATDANNVATSVAHGYNGGTNAICVCDSDAGARDAYAAVGNFQVGTFDATWTLNNAVATQILYIAFGHAKINATWTQSVIPTHTSAVIAPTKSNEKIITTVPNLISGINAVTKGVTKVITTIPNLTTHVNVVALDKTLQWFAIPNLTAAVVPLASIEAIQNREWIQTVIPGIHSGVQPVVPVLSDRTWFQEVVPDNVSDVLPVYVNSDKPIEMPTIDGGHIDVVPTEHLEVGTTGGASWATVEIPTIDAMTIDVVPIEETGVSVEWIQYVVPTVSIDAIPLVTPDIQQDATVEIETIDGGAMDVSATGVAAEEGNVWAQVIIPGGIASVIGNGIDSVQIHQSKTWVQEVIPGIVAKTNPLRPLKWNPFMMEAPTVTVSKRIIETVELDGKSQGDVYLEERKR